VDEVTEWLGHPTSKEYIYVGCYWAKTTGGGPAFEWIRHFDRVGDRVYYRASYQPQVLSDNNGGGGWGASGGQISAVDLSDYVPLTAHAALLQVQFDVDMTAYTGAGGTDITGVAFYGYQSTPPVAFPSSIADVHDVQYIVQPNVASAPAALKRYSFAPFEIPVNDMSGNTPDDPTVDLWVGPYVEQVILHVVGFVENQQHIYRHR
jgi:hypothetical protein